MFFSGMPSIKQTAVKSLNIRRTLVGNKIVDHSVGDAPTTSFST